jgi:predicted amidophosphoribosyltransferase
LINSTTILANNRRKMSQSTNITKIEPDLKVCSNCGEKLDHFWNFCNNCGKELALHKKI